ncbi:hypothetical protein NZK35_15715 [Stieleria sp. ICT_E10.1]|uniref:hypothetical protein n=1 Tax=Stieleria sedimenti TaxID=2976331 RepID=UPI00217FECCD|nr:hypothetical protein [Stieleria sedimenti]MCS7468099.1 hypothetical protein [Stieleria sedimenti]
MIRRSFLVILFASLTFQSAIASGPTLDSLLQTFHEYSGATLVFHRDELPPGRYHDVLKPLDERGKALAAAICLQEAKMYPPRYLEEVGLKTIGVFAACASKRTSDRNRPYDKQLGGYRYFGVYNGSDAIAAALYSEGQLALTFHHEIFHHVDSTVDGETAAWQLSSDDAFYRAAISGSRPYVAPPIAGDDLMALRQRSFGLTLKNAVSQYAAKNAREDQAETARHVMSMLPNALVQIIDQPELAGSQRIMHVLREYEQSVLDGPGLDWFVDVALERADRQREPITIEQLLTRLKDYADGGQSGFDGVADDSRGTRTALKAIVRVPPESVTAQQAAELVALATEITAALLKQRIRPDRSQRRFDIWGREDADGVNHTLRRDIVRLGNDAKRLKLIAQIHQQDSAAEIDQVTRAQLKNLRLVARYYRFIQSGWSVTEGTQNVFESTRKTFLESLGDDRETLYDQLRTKPLPELSRLISNDGELLTRTGS